MINGTWSSDVKEIKDEAFSFFQQKFKERWILRPKLVNPYFKSISMMDVIRIVAPISLNEVKVVVWACRGDKAPGPDGFTFKFLKKYWDMIHTDVMKFVR